MTILTPTCKRCRGKGWVMAENWPTECPACTPTKFQKSRIVVDKAKVAAVLERRKVPVIPVITPRPRARLFDPHGD